MIYSPAFNNKKGNTEHSGVSEVLLFTKSHKWKNGSTRPYTIRSLWRQRFTVSTSPFQSQPKSTTPTIFQNFIPNNRPLPNVFFLQCACLRHPRQPNFCVLSVTHYPIGHQKVVPAGLSKTVLSKRFMFNELIYLIFLSRPKIRFTHGQSHNPIWASCQTAVELTTCISRRVHFPAVLLVRQLISLCHHRPVNSQSNGHPCFWSQDT